MSEQTVEPRHCHDRPTLRDLVTHVIPLVSTKWYDIGLQLLDPKYENELNAIEADARHDAATCCRKMFSKWLNTDGLANWDKLMKALGMVQLHCVAGDIEKLLLQGAPQAPVITGHPQNVTILKGHAVILEVKACGTMPLCYQWYYENDIVPGENKPFYSIYPVTIRNVGHYFCQVKNHYGVACSSIAMVVVESFPTEILSERSANFKKLPMFEMQESTDLASKNESTMTDGSSEDIDAAFSTFVDKMYDALSKENFMKVRRKCLENLNVVGGISLSADAEKKIMVTRKLDDLFDVCCRCRPYWNWMNIRMLEKMAGNSSAAKRLIEGYKKEIFSRKVKDVISEISDLEIPTDKYTEVKEKWDKNFDDLLIQDIVKRWRDIEKKLNVEETMLLKSITAGCVEICWLLPNDLVEHAICAASNDHPDGDDDQSPAQKPVKEEGIGQSFKDGDHLTAQEPVKKDDQSTIQGSVKGGDQSATYDLFPEVSYLKIGDVVIKDDITSFYKTSKEVQLRKIPPYEFKSVADPKISIVTMWKYPRKESSRSSPHKKTFAMDSERLLIMWCQAKKSLKFNYSDVLLTEQIMEVREGPNLNKFGHYSTKKQGNYINRSFSLIFEDELQTSFKNRYAVLQSLDLMCNSHEEQQHWCQTFKSLISPKRHVSMFSSHFEFTDPLILWINSHWTLLSGGKLEIREDEALSFGQSVVPQMPARSLKNKLDVAHRYMLSESSHHGSSLHWDSFVLFYNLLCGIDDSNCLLLKIYQDYAKDSPTLGMTMKEFKNFLIDQQNWSPDDTTDERCDQLIGLYDHYHEPFKKYLAKSNPELFSTSLHLFSFAGFLSFLRSLHNCVTDRNHETVYQDMTQPLSHYFINSSHNTYLEGHQLTGRSTTDAYVRALLQGCRYVELDCWDGPNGEPKVTHGNTLVSELSFEEVVQTINEYAFRVSDYPLILSLENHCNVTQQARMAEIFLNVFKDKLVQRNLVEEESLDRLPSPDNLKKRIILKGRGRSLDERLASDERGRGILQRTQRTFRQFFRPPSTDNDRTNLQASQNLEVLNKENSLESNHSDEQDNLTIVITTAGEIGVASGKSDKTTDSEEEPKPEYEEEQKKLHEDLSKLVVYCQAKRIKPWSWKEQQKTSVCNMFSFVESTALNKCKEHPKELLACTERQFVRTYPSGLKTDSSNHDPHPMWNNGIQMVALNVQTPGLPMYLNQGKFRQNGGCGYVLKPKVMRDPDETVYTPSMTKPHPAVTPVSLKITPLSGQNFIIPNKTTTSMEILYQTYGIPEDCESLKHMVTSENTNPLWPQFSAVLKLDKTILMPELCLVLFAVHINVHPKLKAGTKQVLLGQNVFPLTSLKPGIHFVPLRKPGGDPISHIGIFVKIELSQKQLSDRLQVPTSPHNRPMEDENCDSQTNNATNLESTNIANEVHHKSKKLMQQQAVTVDVHHDSVHSSSSDC